MSTVDDLKRYALNGRGLWVGLFIPAYPPPRHKIAHWLPEDAHLTLLHLGKDREPDEVEKLCEVVARIWKMDTRPLQLELTGVGWFWRRGEPTLISLVNSARVFAMRSMLISLLAEYDVVPNDAFGFVPHVTLKRAYTAFEETAVQQMAREFTAGPGVRVEVPAITVVCGDGAVSY